VASLRDAVNALDARKLSAFNGAVYEATGAEFSPIFIGLDLDYDEVFDVSAAAATTICQELAERLDLDIDEATALAVWPMVQTAWIDGLLTAALRAALR